VLLITIASEGFLLFFHFRHSSVMRAFGVCGEDLLHIKGIGLCQRLLNTERKKLLQTEETPQTIRLLSIENKDLYQGSTIRYNKA
jgi:hypothetical protein